jgi:Tol biopolymer transport system component
MRKLALALMLLSAAACSASATSTPNPTVSPTQVRAPGRSLAATVAPAPSETQEAQARPLCSDRPEPAWLHDLAQNADGVADPAGRIAFGPVSRYTEVAQILGGLYVIDADGTDAARVLSCQLERPRFSPDGSRLAFSIFMSDGSIQVATIGVDGTDLKILTATAGYAQWPDWTPDGTVLFFGQSAEQCDVALDCSNVHFALWQMNSDGSGKRQIGNPQKQYSEGRLSADGAEYVFDRYDPDLGVQGFWIRNLATEEERRVTTTNTGDITHPDWSRDGRLIVYNTNQPGASGPDEQIETVPADDPDASPTVIHGDTEENSFKPAYSPDGARIVFGCGLHICLMDADGSNVEVLVDVPDLELNHPAWGVAPAPR